VADGGNHQTRAQLTEDEEGASRSHGGGVEVTPPFIPPGVVGPLLLLPLPVPLLGLVVKSSGAKGQSCVADACCWAWIAFIVSRYGWSGNTLVCPNLAGIMLGLTWWRCSRAICRRTVLLRVKVR
jgi:hypothetical protein